ncbi:MAG: TetR/AcrR family transcriptional regulator [Candidatus Nanopelagicales bacterium]
MNATRHAAVGARRRGPAPALGSTVERRAILTSAMRVMRQRGLEAWTLDEVLTKAGLGTRSFYRHFESKDALLAELMIEEAGRVGARLQRRVDAAESADAALFAWIDEVLALTRDTRSASKTRNVLRTGLSPEREGWADAHRSLVQSFTQPLASAIEQGLKDGSFPDAILTRDVPLIFTLTFGVVTDMGGWANSNPPEYVRESLMRYIFPALGASFEDITHA